nr:hypothetical protein [Myxococcota bacterium]
MCRFVPLLLAFALVMAGACSAPESVAPDAPSAAAEPEARAASGEAPRPAPSTGEPADSLPPTAALTKLAELRAERTALRHPADGGGRAWLEPVGEPVAVEQARRFELVYEAGPLGVALGGHLRFEASRWWYWSPPQAADPEGPGFTEARAAAPEVVLEARPADRGVAFELVGAALRPGQRVRLVYGAG